MKKVLILLCVIVTVILASCGYSKEDLKRAEYEGYQEGFEEGYDLAQYEAKAEIERIKAEAEYYAKGEIERFKSEHGDATYEAGYERGYEEGYDNCLEEHGFEEESTFDPNDPPRIKKDK